MPRSLGPHSGYPVEQLRLRSLFGVMQGTAGGAHACRPTNDAACCQAARGEA